MMCPTKVIKNGRLSHWVFIAAVFLVAGAASPDEVAASKAKPAASKAKVAASKAADSPPLNVLIITMDDLGYRSLGATGNPLPNLTPHLDQLVREGMLFTNAHVVSTKCGPSRNVMLSGRYPHRNGSMGHGEQPPPNWQPPDIVLPTLSTYLHRHGYMTGAILKQGRLLRQTWDVRYQEDPPRGVGFTDRSPQIFYERTRQFIEEAEAAGLPFFLYANSIDPHDPWPGTEHEARLLEEWAGSKVGGNVYPAPEVRYQSEDVEVPPFIPNHPATREFIAPYFEAVHRGDASMGAILRALEESGKADNTLVIFLSDHGMWFPGGKASLYHAGTHIPLIIRWPGHAEPGQLNEHLVSTVDIVPTVIEAVGLPPLHGLDGVSLVPLLEGKSPADWRDRAYLANNNYDNHNSAPGVDSIRPMRAITSTDYLYIWNGYVERPGAVHRIPYANHPGMRIMKQHPEMEDRAQMLLNRPVEEFYDLRADPGCWNNLIDDPTYVETIRSFRQTLHRIMEATNDPELPYHTPIGTESGSN